MNQNDSISTEEITQRAHEIWEQSGRLDGRDLDNWLEAERQLRNERGTQPLSVMETAAPGATSAKALRGAKTGKGSGRAGLQ